MKTNSILTRWIYSTAATVALAGAASLCQAQSPIVYNFTNGLQGWSGNEPGGAPATYSWNPTNGSTGGGCMQISIDGVTATEMDPIVTLPSTLNENQYLSVSIHMMIDPNSGVAGVNEYGNLQAVFRNASYSWDSIWFGAVTASGWNTYNFVIAPPYQTAEKYLQFQLSGGGNTYNAPLTNYIDNITITPLPDPWVLDAFTASDAGIGSAWDPTEDAPFTNPINHSVTNITPAGSWEIQIVNPNGYSGWNQYQPSGTMDLTRYQYFGFDVYLDNSTGTTYGGMQVLFFKNGWGSPTYVGGLSFNASMVGKWTHFDFPSASMGSSFNASPAFAIQGTPGQDGSTATITFHVDNLVFWSPATLPVLNGLVPGTPGGVQFTVDTDGTANPNDQEGISSPATNNLQNNFWIYQTPASYSFTLVNFPAPAAAPGFDAHMYLINGDSFASDTNEASFTGYQATYSGVPWNALDYAGLRVQNGMNGGVEAIFEWKTNSPFSNPPTNNQTVLNLPTAASANGTWTLTFSDNTDATITAPNGTTKSFTVPDFVNDPNYSGNFSPGTSLIQYGASKNGNTNDNGQSVIFADVLVTNIDIGTVLADDFSGPGLNANNDWQVAEYYLDASDRAIWQPAGTAYWVKWNTTQAGWSVQSSSDLVNWTDAGVTYTYVDTSGTNTLGAVPITNLPAANAGFFRLTK